MGGLGRSGLIDRDERGLAPLPQKRRERDWCARGEIKSREEGQGRVNPQAREKAILQKKTSVKRISQGKVRFGGKMLKSSSKNYKVSLANLAQLQKTERGGEGEKKKNRGEEQGLGINIGNASHREGRAQSREKAKRK